MFNLARFNRLARWTIQHSPAWYLFVHFAACVLITIIVYLLLNEREDILNAAIPFVEPAQFMYGFGWANCLAMVPVAAHFIGRHFRANRETIDYLTLPVSAIERYLVLLGGVFVVIPVIAWLSSLLYFLVVQLVGGDILFPPFKWMWSAFGLALAPYYVIVIVFFALGLLRPQRTILWGVGMMVGIVALVVLIVQTFIISSGIYLPISTSLISLSDSANYFGPAINGLETVELSGAQAFFNSISLFIATAVIAALLLLASAWRSINAKEV